MGRTGVGFGWVVVVVGALLARGAQAQAPRLRVKKVFDPTQSTSLSTINDAGVAAGTQWVVAETFSFNDTGFRCCSSCPPGQADCGACVSLASDSNNCGACGKVCAGGQTCQNGFCR